MAEFIINLSNWTLYLLAAAVFILLTKSVYEEIKKAKGAEKERKKREYLIITACGMLLYVLLTRTPVGEPIRELGLKISEFQQQQYSRATGTPIIRPADPASYLAADNKTQVLPSSNPGEWDY